MKYRAKNRVEIVLVKVMSDSWFGIGSPISVF